VCCLVGRNSILIVPDPAKASTKWNLKVILEDGRYFREIRYRKGSKVGGEDADVHPGGQRLLRCNASGLRGNSTPSLSV
jgi:hypothetical protein